MLYEIRLKVTKPLLGDQHGTHARKFKRAKDGRRILWPAGRWEWALKNAAHSLRMEVDVQTVNLQEDFFAPTTQLCHREWKDVKGKHTEIFESIPIGSVISIYPELPMESHPAGRTVPSLGQLEILMEYVGKLCGMSAWGSDWGYGRFMVESIGEASFQDQFLSAKSSALPEAFLKEYTVRARETRFLGKPICSLSRNELLAVAAHGILTKKQNEE